MRIISPALLLILAWPTLLAQTTNRLAPGAPGKDAHWQTAAKTGFGTANSVASKVWFTLADGVLTEVYYPTLDTPNVQTLQLLIVGSNVATEAEDTNHRIEVVDSESLIFRQTNSAKNGNYTISKTYVTDPRRDTLLIDIKITSRTAENIYVYYDPSLNNSGMHDSGWFESGALLSSEGNKASALVSSSGFTSPARMLSDRLPAKSELDVSSGFLGVNDGLTELRKNWNRAGFTPYQRANDGNLVQVGAIRGMQGSENANSHCTLALGFGSTPQVALANARASLATGFPTIQRQYRNSWHNYTARLPRVETKYQRQFDMAAMVLHGLEDKTFRGATIASPSIPWGGGANANEPTISGYHAVWSRDLYHVATALDAIGDRAGANRALNYLFRRQQKSDGSFPQNTWIDGRPIGGGLQMDQVAFPIVLAYQLQRTENNTWLHHIQPAANYILKHGPATGQDRWEEKPGYSPATIAAEIAGLICAAHIARINGDRGSAALYLNKADEWRRNIERWTATTTGTYERSYYLRITENDDPNDGASIEINSGGGSYDEREIVDAGFLELVRLGIKAADDPLIQKSVAVSDRVLKVSTPFGDAWYRYNHDAYGERPDGGDYDGRNGRGRLWTFLTGERGQYELARGNSGAAHRLLEALGLFANQGLMIPEQIWDREVVPSPTFHFGQGTGSATPLAWSMAQYIRLAMSLSKGRNLDLPEAVVARYQRTGANHRGAQPRRVKGQTK